MASLSPEVLYGVLIVGLFIVARVLQRFRLPAPITWIGLGALMGMGFGMPQEDPTILLLATLGIVTLFLHAGLDVDIDELKENTRALAVFLVLQIVLLSLGAVTFVLVFGLDTRSAFLMSLAVLTPSTGFILDALPGLALDDAQRDWVKTKAIALEVLALAALFYAVQSASVLGLMLATSALVTMIVLLPVVFTGFARLVLPYAPKSEFAFLVIVAFLCAYLTRRLGVYYLVGAFVVGVTAMRMRKKMPELVSAQVLGAVELFATFFVPFYFFKAGMHLSADDFSFEALGIGFALLLVALPLRLVAIMVHRRLHAGEPRSTSVRLGLALLPTLVFTIVIADILRDRYALPRSLYGGLVVYTLVNTMLPGLFLHAGARRPEVPLPEIVHAPAPFAEPLVAAAEVVPEAPAHVPEPVADPRDDAPEPQP